MRFIYSDGIGLKTVDFFEEMIKLIKEKKEKKEKIPEKIEILLTSGGGNTQYNQILAEQIKQVEEMVDITVNNIEQCASAAFDLYMMFSKRKAEPGAYFLVHPETYNFKEDKAEFIMDFVGEAVEMDSFKLDEYFKFFRNHGMSLAEAKQARQRIDMGGEFVFGKNKAIELGVVNAF